MKRFSRSGYRHVRSPEDAAAAVPGCVAATCRRDEAAPMAAAMLLLEVAWADQNITDAELEATRDAVQSMFGLSREQVQALVDRAKAEHDTAISMYPFTRAVNESLSMDDKRHLILLLMAPRGRRQRSRRARGIHDPPHRGSVVRFSRRFHRGEAGSSKSLTARDTGAHSNERDVLTGNRQDHVAVRLIDRHRVAAAVRLVFEARIGSLQDQFAVAPRPCD